jgi:hypothetical protein
MQGFGAPHLRIPSMLDHIAEPVDLVLAWPVMPLPGRLPHCLLAIDHRSLI